MNENLKYFFIVVALLVVFIGSYTLITKEKGCFLESHILLKEEMRESSLCNNEKCLFITTQPIDKNHNYTRELYFAGDNQTLNTKRGFNIGDKLMFKWCENKDLGKYFINGMEKIE